MATLIRVKRKNSGGSSQVTLQGGEPYYNLHDKKLYVGNSTGDTPKEIKDQKHIAEITNSNPDQTTSYNDSGDARIQFTVGEAADNVYSKTINNVAVAKGLILKNIYYGAESVRDQLANNFANGDIPEGTVFFQLADE